MPYLRVTTSKKMDQTLRKYSDDTGIPVAAIVRKAIEEWAQRQGIDLRDDVSWGGSRKVDQDEGQPVAVSAR